VASNGLTPDSSSCNVKHNQRHVAGRERSPSELERAYPSGRQPNLSKAENIETQMQETPLAYNDALLQIKEYASIGFDQVEAGGPEVFEKVWARAFEKLLDLQDDLELPRLDS
jgi:hypothetical protein